ncbi:hypothetical protein [Arcobacter arenosus]|uniref:FAD/FMN-containing dehydrogenase n=1 Tax=Arcobacter arenosus TaxID=2576037 RepID=A0A5R8Y1R0_9BACT|nr:hypothetical protein [Arcobacter arenosus]TLP39183.1 hypothetical protein FDK22_04745 [Arcobacter arenosus]
MKRLLLSLLVMGLSLFASEFKIGDKIETFSILNQHDKKVTIDDSIEKIIVSFEKDTGANINEYLSKKYPLFLKNNKAVFIANISGMPSIITKLFALPKMRKYDHEILLIYDEDDKRFISKEGKSTLYTLKDGIIKSIDFITKDDLDNIFK